MTGFLARGRVAHAQQHNPARAASAILVAPVAAGLVVRLAKHTKAAKAAALQMKMPPRRDLGTGASGAAERQRNRGEIATNRRQAAWAAVIRRAGWSITSRAVTKRSGPWPS